MVKNTNNIHRMEALKDTTRGRLNTRGAAPNHGNATLPGGELS